MATKAVNGKSQTLAARVPHEVVREMQKVRKEGESIGQFVVEALKNEILSRGYLKSHIN
ncbi:YlcI/YnfO family protein [Cronobacter dublinensis]|uniref:YlcI/YnfO family protein n=1 Tax=Cronobacter dublinensis TaxID=413497 RepID=UPI00376FEE39